MVQWLTVCTSTAGGMDLIPHWGTKISHAMWRSQKIIIIIMDWMSSVWQCCDKEWRTVSVFKEFIV